MQLLIIGGGEGKRMAPLTTHKSLYPILGKPLIASLLSSFPPIPKPIIVVSPSSKLAISQVLQDQVQLVVQPEPRGMADAVLCAQKKLDPAAPLLITTASKFLDVSAYETMLSSLSADSSTPHLAAYKSQLLKPGGYLSLTNDQVTGIIEKPAPADLPSPYYKTNLDYFPIAGDFLRALQKASSSKDDLYEVALNHYLSSHPAKLLEIPGAHASLKYPHHVLDVMKLMLTYRLQPYIAKSASIDKSARLTGAVMIDEGALIMANACLIGPCYIGKNTVIGQGTLVRESSLEEGSQIGFGSEVARSYLGPGTKGHMMYVGDSVIEGSVNLSAGTVLANYRFDHAPVILPLPSGKLDTGRQKLGSIIGRDVIIGVNASLMPGTVVGANSQIGAGCVVKGYLPADSVISRSFDNAKK